MYTIRYFSIACEDMCKNVRRVLCKDGDDASESQTPSLATYSMTNHDLNAVRRVNAAVEHVSRSVPMHLLQAGPTRLRHDLR